jgi:hypothetical protein
MAKCPYCPYETPEPDDGDPGVRGWQEVGHMNAEHPDIIRQRLEKYGLLDAGPQFQDREDDN